MGIDGRIFPVAAAPKKAATAKGETPAFEEFLDNWYPIQVAEDRDPSVHGTRLPDLS